MRRAQWSILAALTLAVSAMQPNVARAGLITGSVSLDTSALSGGFELAFALTDGSGTGDGNDTVTFGNFAFGSGGNAGSVDPLLAFGDAGGSLDTSLFLRDSSFLAVIGATFNAGTVLSFDFAVDSGPEAGSTPDLLELVLLAGDGSVVPTSDPAGANALLTIESGFDSIISIHTFASELTPAPVVVTSGAPEPGSLSICLAALLALVASRGGARSSAARPVNARRGLDPRSRRATRSRQGA